MWLWLVLGGCDGSSVKEGETDSASEVDTDTDADSDPETETETETETDTYPSHTDDPIETDLPVDEDGDGVVEALDCDDTDPSIYPGAPELCDGLDNDCDPVTTLEDHSVFLPLSGNPSIDLAPFLDAGPGAPGTFTTTEPGVVQLCPGDHYGTVIVAHDQVTVGPQFAASGGLLDGVTTHAVDVAPSVTGIVVHQLDLLGRGADGGAVRIGAGAEVTIEEVLVAGAMATRGGALFVDDGATLTMSIAEMSGNSADEGGALWIGAFASVIASTTTFEGNSANAGEGGAIRIGASTTFEGTSLTVISNAATGGGGGVAANGSSRVSFDGGSISFNTAGLTGAGLEIVSVTDLSLANLTVADNTSQATGGGLFVSGGAATLDAVTLRTNHAQLGGGGVASVGSTLVIEDAIFEANDGSSVNAPGGAALVSGGTMTTDRTEWFDQLAPDGGVLRLEGSATATVTGGSMTGNLATRPGGASVASVEGGSTLAFVVTDLGTPGLADNGSPEIVTPAGSSSYVGVTTAVCDAAGCVP